MRNRPDISSHRDHQSGNVLFLILIAVALFAALSYAVTQTSRGGSSIDNEKADLLAAQFAQYGAQVSAAVLRANIGNGCDETQLNFGNPLMSHPDYWGGSSNSNAPADGRCDVFGSNGGAVYWDVRKILPNDDPLTNYLTVTSAVAVKNIGTPAAELMMYFVMDNSDAADRVCKSFNKRMGISGDTTSGTTRTLDWGYAAGAGITYYATPPDTNQIGDDPSPSAFEGQMAGCTTGASSHDADNHILYYVLKAR